jgi:hypothetical protein
MEIIRYINGQRLKSNNMGTYLIDSDVISQTIAQVNERLRTIPDNRHKRQINVEIS